MRKITFYPKLAAGNLWRNKTTYIPYLVASVTAVATFYCLLSIYHSESLFSLRGAQYVIVVMTIGIVLLSLLVFALLLWTNSFLIKRRKKELGLYSVLGMEKRNIGILLFFETLFVGAIALVVGLASGMLLARLIFLVLLRLMQFEVAITLGVSFAAIAQTTVFFLLLYLLLLLHNLRQVGKVKPVEMLAGAKQGEKEPRASWLVTLLGIVFTGLGYAFAMMVYDPAWALMLFLFAAISVIIGTYCLFTSGSIALLKLLRRKKSYYYKPQHFISVSGMLYRMKQNAAGLATICILSCMVLVTVSSTVSLYTGSIRDYTYPREYKVSYTIYNHSGDPALGRQLAEQAAAESGLALEDTLYYTQFHMFIYEMEAGSWESKPWDRPSAEVAHLPSHGVYLRLLDEFNTVEGTSYSLNEGEILLFYTGLRWEAPESLTINGITYRVAGLAEEWLGQPYGNEEMEGSLGIMFASEAERQQAIDAHSLYYEAIRFFEDSEEAYDSYGMQGLTSVYNFDMAGGEEAFATLQLAISGLYNEAVAANGIPASIHVSSDWYANGEWLALNGGFLFLGAFFGLLFLLAAALIMYYKQVSEGHDDRDRFEILQKVGMSAREVKKTINKQVRTVFTLPLVIALLHVAVAFRPIGRALIIFNINTFWMQLAATGITFLVYALLYYIIYKQTAKTYFKIVRRNAA